MHFAPRFPGALTAGGAPSLSEGNGATFPFITCEKHYMPRAPGCQGIFSPPASGFCSSTMSRSVRPSSTIGWS